MRWCCTSLDWSTTHGHMWNFKLSAYVKFQVFGFSKLHASVSGIKWHYIMSVWLNVIEHLDYYILLFCYIQINLCTRCLTLYSYEVQGIKWICRIFVKFAQCFFSHVYNLQHLSSLSTGAITNVRYKVDKLSLLPSTF